MSACPSVAEATPFVKAIEDHVAFVGGIGDDGTPGPDGTCCYLLVHDFCY